ncbi:hypothetical protein HPB49_022349 [Dermacentor silvarum]|uniref:Uncharacterized protein n=1 Tax=Dermacentor silvarum TaxID=543639 RepID=A0ACB8D8H8_DERSI|nr:hypothetical protein HPB49_022349 [Dermacentor silvarum]
MAQRWEAGHFLRHVHVCQAIDHHHAAERIFPKVTGLEKAIFIHPKTTTRFECLDDHLDCLVIGGGTSISRLASPVERCTNDQYQRCLASLESVAKGEDITLVTSKRELHHVCRKLKRVVDCVDEHTAQCFDATLQRLFNQVVAGAKETIAEVCLPGDTQDGATAAAAK